MKAPDASRLHALSEFAKTYRTKPAPGVEVIETPRYLMQLIPDFPIPGPNSVSWIRCEKADVEDVIAEVQATAAARGLPLAWILDPDAQPPDLADRLAAHGLMPQEGGGEAAVMILPSESSIDAPAVNGLAIHDAHAGLDSFKAAEQVAAEAFAGIPFGEPTGIDGTRELRYANNRATEGMHGVLATIDGEPAGSGSIRLHPPYGAIINGGAVRPRFRGLGVYRALVVARLQIAREAGVAGLVVWGGHMSAPILSKLGFQTVSWRRFYV
jgi:GNAT superfamily N-acetyltransferase